MTEEKTIKDELKDIRQAILDGDMGRKEKKPKPFKLPFRGRLNHGKLKRGYITVAEIHDNMAVDFKREPIIDGTIKLDNDSYHAVEEFDIFSYKGKPLIFQPKSKLNPYNPIRVPNPLSGVHETYGQKYVMARMEGERITAKKALGWGAASIGMLIIVGVIVYALFSGGS